jgi:hypothetical protein
MSNPNHTVAETVVRDVDFGLSKLIGWVKLHSTPYHIVVASVLGGITVAFFTVIILLIIVATNFNPLGWIE